MRRKGDCVHVPVHVNVPARASPCRTRPLTFLGLLASACKFFHAFLLMNLSLFFLSLLTTRPVQAQQPPSHSWKITYSQSGTWASSARDSPSIGQSTAQSTPWPTSYNTNGGGFFGGAGSLINGDMYGTVMATLTWVPATGHALQSDPPSEPVYIIENASASEAANWGGSGSAPTGQGAVDDGLGDTSVVNGTGLNVSGKHLVAADGSSGTIVLSDTLSAVAPTSTFTPYPPPGYGGGTWNWTSCSCTVGFSVAVDTNSRAVTVSCPTVDTSYNGGSTYRSPALTGSVITNVRQADGTLRGDTVNYPGFSNGGIILGYTATTFGSWSAGSTYHWYSSLTGNSASGLWPNIAEFSLGEPFGSGVSTIDHIFISLYDSGDGAEATGNYYMNFHNHYEPSSWPLDQPPYKVMGADPDAASFATTPPTYPWQIATDENGNVVPPLVGPQGSNAVITFGGSKTQGGHVDGALGVGKDDVSAQFGVGYDWSKSTDWSITINPTPAVGIGLQTWAVCRPSVNRSKGHLDIYGTHGYTGTGLWYRDDIVTTDYNYYQPYAPTNVAPFVPDPGWNPPGYQ